MEATAMLVVKGKLKRTFYISARKRDRIEKDFEDLRGNYLKELEKLRKKYTTKFLKLSKEYGNYCL